MNMNMNMNMNRKTLRSLLSSACLLLLAACSPSADSPATGDGGSADATRLVITGSSTVAPLVAEIAKHYEAEHPGVRIDVQTGGSSRGIADARSGLADLGMASRAMRDDESDLYTVVIARDGVGMIVHADNPVAELSDAEIVAIYTGEIDNWSAVGGADAPITVVNKAEGRATLAVFLEHFGLESSAIQADVVVGDNEQGVKTVAGNPDALGYVSIGTAEYNIEIGTPIRLLAAGGVAATRENVANGTYPISRPLHVVSREEPKGLARDFLDYATSTAVHDVIRDLSFVPPTAPPASAP